MQERPSPLRAATVEDVARHAGISKATAARALGGYGAVSPAVLRRVTAAAEALGYRPNELARSMTTGRTNSLGLVVGDIENPYFGLAARGITDAARAEGFDVVLANTAEDVTFEKNAVRLLLDRRVDGLIVSPSQADDTAHLRDVQHLGRPLVLLDRRVPDLAVDTVTVDNTTAAVEATRHLLEFGHRRIAFISASVSSSDDVLDVEAIPISTVADRITGFTRAAHEYGIQHAGQFVRLGATTAQACQAITTDLLTAPERPTAIFTSDSLIALGVLKVIRALGMSIPADVSVLTFDDSDWTSITSPPLTVVAQPIYDLGSEAARILARRINGDNQAAKDHVFTATLVKRGSVGPPPA
jgi:LacI family transcriptional regulator